MDALTQQQLRHIYQLILAERQTEALDLLRPICQAQPNNVQAWWLVANAVSTPEQARAALQRVLTLDPFHQRAEAMLQTLDASPLPPDPFSPPPLQAQGVMTAPKNAAWSWLGAGLALLILMGLLGGGLFLLMSQNKPDATPQAAQIASPPSATRRTTSVPVGNIITPRAPQDSTPNLPPTWTPLGGPTFTPLPSFTPWWDEGTPRATADPVLFGDTYWEGIGDGYTLDHFMRTGGRYLRFYEFPVKVWMGGQLSARWSDALEDALLEIGQVVPMERVFVENQATLVIYVMSPDEYQRWSGCPGDLTSGCARIVDFGDIAGGDTYHRIYGQVWMNKAARNPHGTLLHEMLHAVGVMVHSPDKNDIMYPFETDAVRMSERDLNTLRRLYANPSYAD